MDWVCFFKDGNGWPTAAFAQSFGSPRDFADLRRYDKGTLASWIGFVFSEADGRAAVGTMTRDTETR